MQQLSINIRGRLFSLENPRVMAIINVTPDSFSDENHCLTPEAILALAKKHLDAGADMLDIGGYSTRPGADEVSPEEEWRRLQMALKIIRQHYPDVPISVDTFRAEVARKAILEGGADIINDISGGQMDAEMFATVAELQVPYILTHTRGTPATMQSLTDYDDLMSEVLAYFRERVAELRRLGVRDIILDPGFGFAKTLEQNYLMLRRMHEFSVLGLPVLAGISHKSMIYRLLGITPYETVPATTALHIVCLQQGASILRVHDTKEAVQVRTLHKLLKY